MLHPLLARLGIEWDADREELFIRMDSPYEHLYITPPRIQDCSEMTRLWNIYSVHKGTVSVPHPFHLEDVSNWLHRLVIASQLWRDILLEPDLPNLSRLGGIPFDTIRDTMGGPPMGSMTLQIEENKKCRPIKNLEDPEPTQYLPGNLEVPQVTWRAGYFIDPDHSGKGITTAALKRFLRLVQELTFLIDPKAPPIKVNAAFWDDNLASKRILEKCGFQFALRGFEKKGDQRLPYTRLEWHGSVDKAA